MTFHFLNEAFKLFTLDYDAFKEIKSNINWYTPFIFAWIISTISIILSDITSILNRTDISINIIFEITNALKYIFYPIAIIILTSAIIHILMKLFGGKTNFLENIKFNSTIIGIVTLVILFIVQPINLLSTFFGLSIQISLLTLCIVLTILIIIWSLFLSLKVFSNLYNMTLVKTFLALIIIPISLLVLTLILISIGIVSKNIIF